MIIITLVPAVSQLRHTSSSTFFDRNTSFLFSEDLFCLRGCTAFGNMLWNLLTKVSGMQMEKTYSELGMLPFCIN